MHTSQISDSELVGKYLSGHEASLEVLITRHKSKVYGMIRQKVQQKEIAEDLFQDTFIKVINTLKKDGYQEEGKFAQWVMRIARNLVMDYFRDAKKMRTVSGGNEYNIFDTINLKVSNVEDQIIKKQIHADLRKLIDALPREQREVVIMRHYQELSFKEISEILNISINTSLGRMRYALLAMRKMMHEHKVILS